MWLSSKETKCAASYASMILADLDVCWDLASDDYCESIGWSTVKLMPLFAVGLTPKRSLKDNSKKIAFVLFYMRNRAWLC